MSSPFPLSVSLAEEFNIPACVDDLLKFQTHAESVLDSLKSSDLFYLLDTSDTLKIDIRLGGYIIRISQGTYMRVDLLNVRNGLILLGLVDYAHRLIKSDILDRLIALLHSDTEFEFVDD
jgi:hypothetical protein